MALRSLVLCAARASKRQRSFSRRSARSTIEVKGLRAGGDDYLPKPYSFLELLARAEVLARPRPSQEERAFRVGDLEVERTRTRRSPPSGSRTRLHAFTHGTSCASRDRRT